MCGEFVSPSAGTSPALQTAEIVLNAIALPVELAADFTLDSASGSTRNTMGCSELLKLLTQLVTVEAFVANQAQPYRVSQQWENMMSS